MKAMKMVKLTRFGLICHQTVDQYVQYVVACERLKLAGAKTDWGHGSGQGRVG